MILSLETPECYKYRVYVDGVDVSAVCRYADEEAGVAFCMLLIKANCHAITNDLPGDWIGVPADQVLMYERRGHVRIEKVAS